MQQTTTPERDVRERAGDRLLRFINPLARRLIQRGLPTGAPNVLLTVPGRRSGKPRTTPVAVLELDGRRFIQATYGDRGWARNLRAAGAATITDGDRRERVLAAELPADEAGAIMRGALQSYHRSGLLRTLLGPNWRPPAVILRTIHVRVDDTPEEYATEARRHPLFELRPAS
jgi:deazaflavin-dependent oxidoreductase (nitroreductase family)